MCEPLVLNVLITVQISSISVLRWENGKMKTPGSPVTDRGVTSKSAVYVCLVKKDGLNRSGVVV